MEVGNRPIIVVLSVCAGATVLCRSTPLVVIPEPRKSTEFAYFVEGALN